MICVTTISHCIELHGKHDCSRYFELLVLRRTLLSCALCAYIVPLQHNNGMLGLHCRLLYGYVVLGFGLLQLMPVDVQCRIITGAGVDLAAAM